MEQQIHVAIIIDVFYMRLTMCLFRLRRPEPHSVWIYLKGVKVC